MANLKEKDQNPIQDDYEEKFGFSSGEDSPTSSSGYSGGNSDDEAANLNDRENRPDKDDGGSLAPEKQAEQEGLGDSNLYDPSGSQQHHKPSLKNQVKGLFAGKKRKAGWISGGIVGILLGGFLTLFPVLGPIHIFSNLMDHNFEYNDSFRRNRTGRVVRSILNNNKTNRNLRDTPFKLKADLVDFEKFEVRMQDSGWRFDYDANGKAIGLIDPTGRAIDLSESGISRSEFNRRIQPLIDDTIPAWRMNKRVRTRSLISTFTGPRRSFNWTDLFSRQAREAEPEFETRKFKKEAGLDDIDVDGVRVRESTGFDEDGNRTYSDADSSSGNATQDAQRAVIDAKLDGASDAEAIRIGVAELDKVSSPSSGKTSVVIGSIVASCMAYTVYENEIFAKFERYTAALRLGATFMLATNEIQQGGDIDIGEVGQQFNEYNNEDGSFAESAAWQRATGSEVTGPEINDELRVNPPEDSQSLFGGIFQGAINTIGEGVAQIPGFSLVCKALSSTFGFIAGIAFDVIEGAIAGLACLTGAGCLALGKFAVAEAMFEFAARMLTASMTAFAGFLTENPVQAAAVLDQSLNLTSSEESRTAQPVESEEYNTQLATFKQERSQNLPFSERYLALDNPNSLVAALAKTKMNLQSIRPDKAIASLFNLPGNSLIAVATSRNVYAQTDIDFDNYGFQKYSYNNSYINSDPFVLAEEVTEAIEADSSIYLNGDNGRYERDFAVMCMGYVPERGVVNKSSNSNFLPQYSDPETTNAQQRNDAFQRVCIDEANKDPELYAKIGRFVDDIELISSIIELTGEQVPATSGNTGGGNGSGDGGGGGGSLVPEPEPEPNPEPPVCDPNSSTGDPCLN